MGDEQVEARQKWRKMKPTQWIPEEVIWQIAKLRELADLIEQSACEVDIFRVNMDRPDGPGRELTELHIVAHRYQDPFVDEVSDG